MTDTPEIALELSALAEVIKIWLPGLKADPNVVAQRMRLGLLKRGIALVDRGRLSEMRSALEFYADPLNWTNDDQVNSDEQFGTAMSYECDEHGKRARFALAEAGAL